jgi:hypothetical protein
MFGLKKLLWYDINFIRYCLVRCTKTIVDGMVLDGMIKVECLISLRLYEMVHNFV